MEFGGYKKQQDWKRSLLFKIAKEELVEGVKEVLEIKTINRNDRLYKIVVRVKDADGEYVVHIIIQLMPPAAKDGYLWRLIDLSWEEVKK